MLARADVRAMSVTWSNERVLQLIELYKNFECLWNTAHCDNKNKFIKREAWDSIAKMMELPLKEVESKIHTLRSQFTRERKKFKSMNKNGSGSEEVIKITWFAYEPLQFLLKVETPGNKDSSLPQMDDSISASEAQQFNTDEEQDNEAQQNEISVDTRRRKRVTEDKMNGAYEVIKTKKRLRDGDETDEFDVYGKYVASELRNIKDEYSTLIAKQYINNILIDARFGKYRQRFQSYQRNSANTPDPLTTVHVTPQIKIEERNSFNSEQGSLQNSIQDI